MHLSALALLTLLAATSLQAAELAPAQSKTVERLQHDANLGPGHFIFKIKIVEGNPHQKETHKVLGKEVSLTTLKDRASRYNTGVEVRLPPVPGSRDEYVPLGMNILITPLALDGDTVRLDLQMQKINLVTSNDKEFESETSSRRWNKTVTVGQSNTFVLDKNSEKQAWLEVVVLVNRFD
jgi:hypothetical protein